MQNREGAFRDVSNALVAYQKIRQRREGLEQQTTAAAAVRLARLRDMGARLEYLQTPLVFSFGAVLITMVGTNIGAGRTLRARRIAWAGAGLAAAMTGSVGLLGACFPHLWLGLFSAAPEVLAAGSTYLTIVGPTYGFLGLGLALYFASQGAGQLLWPLLAGVARLVMAAGGGWLAIHWFGGGLPALFTAIAVALADYGTMVAGAVKAGAWREKIPRLQAQTRD